MSYKEKIEKQERFLNIANNCLIAANKLTEVFHAMLHKTAQAAQ